MGKKEVWLAGFAQIGVLRGGRTEGVRGCRGPNEKTQGYARIVHRTPGKDQPDRCTAAGGAGGARKKSSRSQLASVE